MRNTARIDDQNVSSNGSPILIAFPSDVVVALAAADDALAPPEVGLRVAPDPSIS